MDDRGRVDSAGASWSVIDASAGPEGCSGRSRGTGDGVDGKFESDEFYLFDGGDRHGALRVCIRKVKASLRSECWNMNFTWQ